MLRDEGRWCSWRPTRRVRTSRTRLLTYKHPRGGQVNADAAYGMRDKREAGQTNVNTIAPPECQPREVDLLLHKLKNWQGAM